MQHIQHPSREWTELQAAGGGPLAPLHRIDDALQAMGIALFHLGSATLQYGIIRDHANRQDPGAETLPQLQERYLWAENDARLAHSVLHRVHRDLADRHPLGLGPEIRKSCRQAHLWLTRERRAAALALGIRPPPQADGSVASDALDHRFDPRESRHLL